MRRKAMQMRWIWAVAAVELLAAALAVIGGPASAQPGPLCGSMAGRTPHITKVMWIFMENRSYGTGASQIPGDPSASYIDHTLIAHCGSTSNYVGVTHPSYANYLAATSGSTQGATTDKLHYYRVPNLFGQVDPSWRSYQEFMPTNCSHAWQTGNPATRQYYLSNHNPASSYSSLPVGAPAAGDCPRYDTPLGSTRSGPLATAVAAGALPAFSLVTPGLCDDMHALPAGLPGCADPVAAGDAWLATWIPVITAGPDYASGHLVVDIAWDEARGGRAGQNCIGSSSPSCLAPNIVISPYTRHVVSGTAFSHYSLLKMTETLLGKRYLGAAGAPTTIDMCRDFGLCPQLAARPPAARFTSRCTGATCTFNGYRSRAPGGGITAFRWRFGDGSTASGQKVRHTFKTAGTHKVSLTVTSDAGLTGSARRHVRAGPA